MSIHRKFATYAAALFGASLAVAVSAPAAASPPTRFEVCPAILSEPICDLVRPPESSSDGSGTRPAVRPVSVERRAAIDLSCTGTSLTTVAVCVG
jgi:hypothetical protein